MLIYTHTRTHCYLCEIRIRVGKKISKLKRYAHTPFKFQRWNENQPLKIHYKILHFYLYSNSVGRTLRTIAESDPKANTENHKIKNAIASGEMINKQSIQKILEAHLINLSEKKGIIIDGYPRDIKQVTDFEEKVFLPILYGSLSFGKYFYSRKVVIFFS